MKDKSPEFFAKKIIELVKSATSTANEVIISSIIQRRDKLADIVENFGKEGETIKFMRQKSIEQEKIEIFEQQLMFRFQRYSRQD